MSSKGIVYEYEDGGTYCGEWEKDSSHGYGCGTGPKAQGRYEGLWEHGDQVSGVYTWPNGMKYTGSWKNNKREGLGKETREDGIEYCGEFIRGARGPYGVTKLLNGVYRGSWRNGKQDGEGEEVYLDGGCYRGQYKNGVRSGFGTRTSSAYEHRDKDASKTHDQATTSRQRALSNLVAPFTNLKRLSYSGPFGSEDQSDSCVRGDVKAIMQIYEGEWRDDKRHGYGVIKCVGSYTYYGQWSANTQTGYGVLVFENGVKEEGQWHNGQLIVALKRKKLHIKSHQLETKVQTAHTQAIQAADTARNKALLAESRAGTALGKTKMSQGVVITAEKNAMLAKEKAELYKNATRISEGLKSPVIDTSMCFPPTPPTSRLRSDSQLNSRGNDSPSIGRHLEVTISPSPSFEFLAHRASSRESNEEVDSVSEFEVDADAASRRKRFYTHSSTSGDSHSITDDELQSKREDYSKNMSASEQVLYPFHDSLLDHVYRRISEGGNRERGRWRGPFRSLPGTVAEEREGDEMNVVRRPTRDNTTGEIKNSNSDEETTEDKLQKKSAGKPKPVLKQKSSLSMDILMNNLNQMANWNKMIAYINFFLLIFLLILILIVVISMNYYQLVSFYHNHTPEDHGPIVPIGPIA